MYVCKLIVFMNFNILMIPVRATSTYIGVLDLYCLVVVDSEDSNETCTSLILVMNCIL